VGGLIEHTVNVTFIAERLTQLYTCNQELVLAGALLHDIGKLEELEEQPGVGFTPAGRMFGHIILGTQYVHDHARQVSTLAEAPIHDLLHIILAHHGTKEYGSPVCPATIEALMVHLADTTEAKLTGFLDHCDRSSNADGWSSYSKDIGGQLRIP
jgi:3'-5' exoribonuclease